MGINKEQLFGICMRYASSKKEAEAILIESFDTLIANNVLIPQSSCPAIPVKHIVIDTVLERYKKQSPASHAQVKPQENQHVSFDAINLKSLSNADLLKILQRLPTLQRIVFNLHAIDQWHLTEISEKLNLSEFKCFLCYEEAITMLYREAALQKPTQKGFYPKTGFISVSFLLFVAVILGLCLAAKSGNFDFNCTPKHTQLKSTVPDSKQLPNKQSTTLTKKEQKQEQKLIHHSFSYEMSLPVKQQLFRNLPIEPLCLVVPEKLRPGQLDCPGTYPEESSALSTSRTKSIGFHLGTSSTNEPRRAGGKRMHSSTTNLISISGNYEYSKKISFEAVLTYEGPSTKPRIDEVLRHTVQDNNTFIQENAVGLSALIRSNIFSLKKLSMYHSLGMSFKRIRSSSLETRNTNDYISPVYIKKTILPHALLNLGINYKINSNFTLCGQTGIEANGITTCKVNWQGGLRFNLLNRQYPPIGSNSLKHEQK